MIVDNLTDFNDRYMIMFEITGKASFQRNGYPRMSDNRFLFMSALRHGKW